MKTSEPEVPVAEVVKKTEPQNIRSKPKPPFRSGGRQLIINLIVSSGEEKCAPFI